MAKTDPNHLVVLQGALILSLALFFPIAKWGPGILIPFFKVFFSIGAVIFAVYIAAKIFSLIQTPPNLLVLIMGLLLLGIAQLFVHQAKGFRGNWHFAIGMGSLILLAVVAGFAMKLLATFHAHPNRGIALTAIILLTISLSYLVHRSGGGALFNMLSGLLFILFMMLYFGSFFAVCNDAIIRNRPWWPFFIAFLLSLAGGWFVGMPGIFVWLFSLLIWVLTRPKLKMPASL